VQISTKYVAYNWRVGWSIKFLSTCFRRFKGWSERILRKNGDGYFHPIVNSSRPKSLYDSYDDNDDNEDNQENDDNDDNINNKDNRVVSLFKWLYSKLTGQSTEGNKSTKTTKTTMKKKVKTAKKAPLRKETTMHKVALISDLPLNGELLWYYWQRYFDQQLVSAHDLLSIRQWVDLKNIVKVDMFMNVSHLDNGIVSLLDRIIAFSAEKLYLCTKECPKKCTQCSFYTGSFGKLLREDRLDALKRVSCWGS